MSVWLRGEYEFAALFSYRIPNFSSAFAPCAPMPGPSTFKLALVSTRIETTGQIAEGEQLFEIVKRARVGLEPAEWLTISRTFQRRLKKLKNGTIGQSFGIREYAHHSGLISLYIEVADDAVNLVTDTMQRLRRIGTSDSLLYCRMVKQALPDFTLTAQPIEAFNAVLDPDLFMNRPVVPLLDIRSSASFANANPYNKAPSDFTEQRLYIFPLRLEKQGEGWTRYRREPFSPLTHPRNS